MTQIVVNNTNMIIETSPPAFQTRQARLERQQRMRALHHAARPADQAPQELARRQIDQARRQVVGVACSSTWAEDCLYRGAEYAPDFRCQCAVCRAEFPDRRYPRPAMESRYSVDCQVEADVDPELAEDLARLRNDRLRAGSVCIDFHRQGRAD
jgi:hypothetical protein